MSDVERIVVEPPEDARDFSVGDELFGRAIVRVDHDRGVLWARPPTLWHRLRRWLKHAWRGS